MTSSVKSAAAVPPLARELSLAERFGTFTHALAFVLGFSTIFIGVFGLPLYGVGQMLGSYKAFLALVGGIVVILFGLTTMDVLRIPLLSMDTRKQWGGRRDWGYLSSYLMGVFFAAGWSPCIGTTLGAIATMSYSQGTVGQALFLLVAYSAGMGLPFLLVGLGVDRAARGLRRLQRHMRTIKVISGILLISVGLLVLVDALPQAAFMLGEMVGQPLGFSWPIWLPSLSYIASVSLQNGLYIDPGEGSLASPTALIAFFAGVLSFLSPCVLPLVPAYVSYLSGRAVGAAG